MYKLRPYQQEAVDRAVSFFRSDKKGGAVLVLPTGAGKSLVVANIAAQLNEPTIVLQPSKEILEQNYAKLCSYGTRFAGIFSASFGRKEIMPITFATIGSVKRHANSFRMFKHIIIDECHSVNAKEGMYKEFIDALGCKVLGLTATPYRLCSYREYGSILKFITRTKTRIFNEVLYAIQVRELLHQGFLAQLKYYRLNIVDTRQLTINSTGADYTDQSVKRHYNAIDFQRQLVGIVNRLLNAGRDSLLVFTRFVEEAEHITQMFPDYSAVVSGTTPKGEREDILQRFKSGRIKVVANVGVLTCLSEDTEILTRGGWKTIRTISTSDLVAQYDNEEISFSHPLRIIRKQYHDDFVGVDGRYMSIKITKDHKVFYKKHAKRGLSKIRCKIACNLVGESVFIPVSGYAEVEKIEAPSRTPLVYMRRFINYNAYNYRKKGCSYEEAELKALKLYKRRFCTKVKSPSELTLDECTFIGFWIGDGTSSCGRYSITQSTKTPKMCKWVEDLLNRTGVKYTVKEYFAIGEGIINGRKCNIGGHKIYALPKGTGGDGQEVNTTLTAIIPYLRKEGSELFWGLNKQQILSLCNGLTMADGWHGDAKDDIRLYFYSREKNLLDLLQGICACRGLTLRFSPVNRAMYKTDFYKVCVSDKLYHQLSNDRLDIIHNDLPQDVWCVTMPKGTIITRRNGRVSILGNCGFDFPALSTVVLARPTMSLALYYQMVGRAIRPYPGKDAWIVDLCGNYDRFGKVEDLELREPKKGLWAVYSGEKQLTNVFYGREKNH